MKIKPVVQHMQFMSEDTPICDVWYCFATNFIKVVNHTDNWLILPFGKKIHPQSHLNTLRIS